jgi:hypothetical protein
LTASCAFTTPGTFVAENVEPATEITRSGSRMTGLAIPRATLGPGAATTTSMAQARAFSFIVLIVSPHGINAV